MTVLVIAEHDCASLKGVTLHTVTAASGKRASNYALAPVAEV